MGVSSENVDNFFLNLAYIYIEPEVHLGMNWMEFKTHGMAQGIYVVTLRCSKALPSYKITIQ